MFQDQFDILGWASASCFSACSKRPANICQWAFGLWYSWKWWWKTADILQGFFRVYLSPFWVTLTARLKHMIVCGHFVFSRWSFSNWILLKRTSHRQPHITMVLIQWDQASHISTHSFDESWGPKDWHLCIFHNVAGRKLGNNAGNIDETTEQLWQAFFANPLDWWDNRKNKVIYWVC